MDTHFLEVNHKFFSVSFPFPQIIHRFINIFLVLPSFPFGEKFSYHGNAFCSRFLCQKTQSFRFNPSLVHKHVNVLISASFPEKNSPLMEMHSILVFFPFIKNGKTHQIIYIANSLVRYTSLLHYSSGDRLQQTILPLFSRILVPKRQFSFFLFLFTRPPRNLPTSPPS